METVIITTTTASVSEKLSTAITTSAPAATTVASVNKCDEESQRGHFGWVTIAEQLIPYIIRKEDKYCAVRIIETKLLDKFFSILHQEIFNEVCVKSYYITRAEVHLLNEINFNHSDCQFGVKEFTTLDLIVRVSDVIELYNFLSTCYTILSQKNTKLLDRCGYITINKETVMPYTVHLGEKYVPLFYFEDESNSLKLNVDKVEGWDLAYLKFCCKIQGIREELYSQDSCSVLSLGNLKKYFPPNTSIKCCWPTKIVGSKLLTIGTKQSPKREWVHRPTEPPLLYIQPPPGITVVPTGTFTNTLQGTQLLNASRIFSTGQVTLLPPRMQTFVIRPVNNNTM